MIGAYRLFMERIKTGKDLAVERKRRGYSQETFALLLQVHRNTVNNWEHCERLEHVVACAAMFVLSDRKPLLEGVENEVSVDSENKNQTTKDANGGGAAKK